jgi:uridine kinase
MPSSHETFDQLEKLFKYNELPVVIMLMGLPGSGKTTFRKQLIERFPDMNFSSLSTDDFLDVRAEKLGITYDEAFLKYSGAALDNFNSQIQSFTDE